MGDCCSFWRMPRVKLRAARKAPDWGCEPVKKLSGTMADGFKVRMRMGFSPYGFIFPADKAVSWRGFLANQALSVFRRVSGSMPLRPRDLCAAARPGRLPSRLTDPGRDAKMKKIFERSVLMSVLSVFVMFN